ncbi:Killer toxin subunits alpha/beta [Colletotrichum sp. SAR 10_96]|nr:Killer toxin subunits alpha/beta [Colletotrichum sp. SAR 10_96]
MRPFIFLTFAALGLALPSDITRNATDGVAEPTSSAIPSKPVLIPDDSVVNNSTERKLNLGVKAISPASDVQTNTPWSTPLIDDCPKLCSVVGPDPSNWTRVQHEDDLIRCKAPLLFDFNFHITGSVKTFRTCALEPPQSTSTARRYVPVEARQNNESISAFSPDNGPKVCGASESTLQLLLSTSPTGVISSGADAAAAAAKMLGSHLAETASCGRTILFARVDTAIVALYVSADVVTTSVATISLGDLCWSIADTYGITETDLEKYNANSWGWAGCNSLKQDQIICISKGNTPMPIADNVKDQFDKFVSMDAPFKKIISFGGWAESTDPATYQLYRDAVSPTNRERVASNVLRFLDANPGLDGVDFDWEYPGADDQGIPGSDPVDAIYYSRFLSLMRDKLGKNGRSLSIAIPASYWYLKPFPVEDMAKVLDYFIYMTYDLHGQWDYGNKYANPGCENGNCLRSHVNITETTNSLVMLTKAGVSADKIIVGVTSYGRSFRMADKSCTGRNCLFTGSRTVSEAEPGICTDTGGYISNAELDQIFTFAEEGEPGYEAKRWHDGPTNSDIMTYGTTGNGMTDWVAYMSDTTKSTRSDWIKGLNFGGTTDWAIDLLNFLGAPEGQEGGFTVDGGENLECNSETWPTNLDDLEKNIDNVPPHCRSMALLNVLIRDLEKVIAEYKDVASSSDYDDRFWWYADWVKDSIDDRLEEFLKIGTGEGLKYMDCEWSSKGNSGEGPCTEAHLSYPPGPSPGPRTVTFTMRDETGFYDALASKAGIQREWITWRDMDAINDPCVCPPTQPGICTVDCTMNYYMRKNWPKRVSDKDKIEIENPKSIIEEAIPSTDVLIGTIVGTYIEMRMDVLDADEADVLTAFSMPLLMMQDASNSIKEIKDIGKEQKETKTRELVLGILSIVFAVIPFAGQAASALGGAARLASMALIIGEAGNAAISIVDIVKDPNSAPFAILGMLVGAAGMRGGKPPREAFAEAGKARRALTPKMMESFSPEFRRKDGLVQNVVKTCKVR